ncbi:MAG: hypothetical protein EAZ95_12875 [Bacteroidetes bacterium]|nr:MAG: hypothetical protein EAZ95_12875 [Bacteroidota bacterium]
MNPTIQALLDLERETRSLHQQYYALQEAKLDFTVNLSLIQLELRFDTNFELDLDYVESLLMLENEAISRAIQALTELQVRIDLNLFQIENL